MSAQCRYHCSSCGSHFTSLEAFDAHHEGAGETLRPCEFPGADSLVEREGVCKISEYRDGEAIPVMGTVHEHVKASRVRNHWKGGGRPSGAANPAQTPIHEDAA
jgi:hypothetical protein